MIFVFMLELVFKIKSFYRKIKKTKRSSLKKTFIDDLYEIERLLNKKTTKKQKINNLIFNKMKKMKIVT